MPRHRTTLEHASVAGWVPFDDGWEITVIPVVDKRYVVDGGQVFGRPTYNDSLQICQKYDAEIITPDDVEQIRETGLMLVPFLGTPTAEVTLHHSRLHDADMWRQLHELGWQGDRVVMNCLKWWMAGAPAKRSRLKGWFLDPAFPPEVLAKFRGIPDQGQGGKLRTVEPGEYIQPDMVAHNRHQHDDGTGLMMKREARGENRLDSEVQRITPITERATPDSIADSTMIPPPPSIPTPAPGSTDPSMTLPWLDPELTHGERVVVYLEELIDKGVREDPNGSNNGPEIGAMLEPCMRDGQGNIGKYLKRTGANWCAACRCSAIWNTRIETDPEVGHGYRCSGIELEKDTKASGWYRPVSLVVTGEWVPEPGDGVLLPRGKPGGWQRHVATIIGWDGESTITTIDGNKGNRVQTWEYGLHELLGFFEMPSANPRHNYRGAVPDLPELIDDLNDGENVAA